MVRTYIVVVNTNTTFVHRSLFGVVLFGCERWEKGSISNIFVVEALSSPQLSLGCVSEAHKHTNHGVSKHTHTNGKYRSLIEEFEVQKKPLVVNLFAYNNNRKKETITTFASSKIIFWDSYSDKHSGCEQNSKQLYTENNNSASVIQTKRHSISISNKR